MNESKKETFHAVRSAITTVLKVPEDQVVAHGNIRDLRNVDSMALMEVVALTESQLGIDIDVGLLFEVETVGAFVDLCEKLRS